MVVIFTGTLPIRDLFVGFILFRRIRRMRLILQVSGTTTLFENGTASV